MKKKQSGICRQKYHISEIVLPAFMVSEIRCGICGNRITHCAPGKRDFQEIAETYKNADLILGFVPVLY